jgi:hypothetical protein
MVLYTSAIDPAVLKIRTSLPKKVTKGGITGRKEIKAIPLTTKSGAINETALVVLSKY